MQVKEAVIAYMKRELPKSESMEQTKNWAKSNTGEIVELAERVVEENGYDYSVKAEVTTCDFPKKTYGDITFPKGEYEALRIEIGESKGQNWWCVLFPPLCLSAATQKRANEEAFVAVGLNSEQYKIITETDEVKYKLKFKILEAIYGNK
jgi:stage II sporulation protein R